MIQYGTTLNPGAPGITPYPKASSPYKAYGQNHMDVLGSLRDANAATFDIEQTKANTDYELKRQDAERQLVLQGLQQMASAQQNENAIKNSRMSNVNGVVSGLLGGLFR